MTVNRAKWALVALACLAAWPAHAEQWKIDSVHSTVGFSIRHMMVSNVKGSFTQFAGTIGYDPQAPQAASVEVTIQTTSVNTGNEKRDGHLRNEDFFDAPKFPTITFKSTKVTPSGDSAATIEGTLTMHGESRPVTLQVEKLGIQKDPQGKTRAGFSGKTKVARKDFGIIYNKALDGGGVVLGDDVNVELEIEAVQTGTPAAVTGPAK
jgi:polyisoprenoid-binding protein YceI